MESEITELKSQLQKYKDLYQLLKTILSTINLNELLELILKMACDTFKADAGSIMLFDENRNELVVEAATGPRKEKIIGKRCKLDERVVGRVAKIKTPILINGDVRDDSRFIGITKFEEVMSGMSIPIITQDNRLVGVINLERLCSNEKNTSLDTKSYTTTQDIQQGNSYEIQEVISHNGHLTGFTKEDLDKAYLFASEVAGAIDNAITYQRLKMAYEKLKEAELQIIQNEKLVALGELTAGVAHELNQPLNAIKIICQDIYRDLTSGKFHPDIVKEDMRDIVSQVDRMAEIINHMRIFSRREVGEDRQKIDINMPIEGVLKLFGGQFKVHNIELKKELRKDLPRVNAHPGKLEQVFLNLITNARDAVEKAQKRDKTIIVRSFFTEETSLPEVVVEIEDNGVGIPEKIINRIFDPFFTTKQPGKGTGLGLSISKKLIEEQGGRIEVESVPGKGTIFRVILPAAD